MQFSKTAVSKMAMCVVIGISLALMLTLHWWGSQWWQISISLIGGIAVGFLLWDWKECLSILSQVRIKFEDALAKKPFIDDKVMKLIKKRLAKVFSYRFLSTCFKFGLSVFFLVYLFMLSKPAEHLHLATGLFILFVSLYFYAALSSIELYKWYKLNKIKSWRDVVKVEWRSLIGQALWNLVVLGRALRFVVVLLVSVVYFLLLLLKLPFWLLQEVGKHNALVLIGMNIVLGFSVGFLMESLIWGNISGLAGLGVALRMKRADQVKFSSEKMGFLWGQWIPNSAIYDKYLKRA